jgi:uncharacterized protein YndB with AHSA1/START domain
MQVDAEITVARRRSEVFEYLARAEHLPEYMTDFAWVRQESEGAPGEGTEYSYELARGRAKGTFRWRDFRPPSRLAWDGPPATTRLGSMEPSGWWELSEVDGATRIRLVMAPNPGGMFKLLAPLMSAGMRKSNASSLERLKQRLERASGSV